MALKRQCPEVRQREAQAMALKHQCPEVRERTRSSAPKHQCPEVREREAQDMALKCQCPEVREREVQVKSRKRQQMIVRIRIEEIRRIQS